MRHSSTTALGKPPKLLKPRLDAIPAELTRLPQWVDWKLEPLGGAWMKIPYDAHAKTCKAKANDPKTWSTFDRACSWMNTHGGGIGFVFNGDGIMGVDLDKCRDPETATIEPWAQSILDKLNSYSEVSPSGSGLHIIIRGTIPGKRNRTGRIEMYSVGRYFCVTGIHVEGTPTTIENRNDELAELYRETFEVEAAGTNGGSAKAPALDDDALIEKAKAASNGDKFSALWQGDSTAYTSASEADLALCRHLAFWCGNDPARVDRLFRRSGLYRDKWDREDYRETTLQKAIEGNGETYQAPKGGGGGGPRTTWNTTDLGNGERLVAQHGKNIHCIGNRWFIWNSQVWKEDRTNGIGRMAKRTVKRIYREAADEPNDGERKALATWASRSESRTRVDNMIELARSEDGIAIVPEDLDTNDWLLACRNGTIDLRTGELRTSQREDLITRQSPVAYDAAAQCPTWELFLEQVLGNDADLIEYVQRAIGYCLTGDIREQCFFFLFGKGNNGKSTFLTVLRSLLGDYAHRMRAETILAKRTDEHPEAIASLRGARFVTASETAEGRRLAEGLVKDMCGGETLRARFMRQDSFEFLPTFKLWLSSNSKPQVRDTSLAMWRRVRMIPFAYQVVEGQEDKELLAKLEGELPGILRWAVRGCLRWQEEGLAAPEIVKEATQAYREESDTLGLFLQESCEFGRDYSESSKELYKAYCYWMDVNGQGKPPSNSQIGRNLKERPGLRPDQENNKARTRIWRGLRLLADAAAPSDYCIKKGRR